MMIRLGRPDERVKLGNVTGTTMLSEGFLPTYLINERPDFPVRTSGAASLTVTPDATRSDVNVLAVLHHACEPDDTITVGSLGAVEITEWGEDGIAFNNATILDTPASTGASFVVTSGSPILIGELWVGKLRSFNDFLIGRSLDHGTMFAWESAMPPNHDGYSDIRRYTGTIVVNDDDFLDLQAAYRATRKGSEPTLIILDQEDEVLLAQWRMSATHARPFHAVNIEIVEIPRPEW